MNINYLNELNEVQQQAVTCVDGPLLVIAGAGSGKTRVLTYRIAYLLQQGVSPSSVLALTFTNKAAGEMKERIAKVTGPDTARYLWMGTFHSIFARILRYECELLGYKPGFTIYDASDSKSLVRTIIKEMSLDDKVYKPSNILGRISAAKNNLVTSRMYSGNNTLQEYDNTNRTPLFSEIYKTYSIRCFKANAMDFDDLLLNTNILFRDFPDTLLKYQNKFSHILVDEYQDTNYSQYLIVNKLAALHRNVCVVGDDAQSIYSFRGARIENILNFKNDYPEYKLFKLERNYRSTRIIVDVANDVIANNQDQIQKRVFSENEEGEKINVFKNVTDIEEGVTIASDIYSKRTANHLQWSDFAILYRTNAQSRIFEEAFRKKNIPYKIYGGQSFYDRKEIRDILGYFRFIVNHDDEEALKRIINYPKRGIGDTSMAKIYELARQNDLSIWTIISEPSYCQDVVSSGTIVRLRSFVEMINKMTQDIEQRDAFSIATSVAADSGIMKELRESTLPEDVSRYENVEELLNGIKAFTEDAETNGDETTLQAYLSNVALLTDQDNESDDDRNKVTLMTIHSAKGLEFNQIYVVGLEDTLFPSPMCSGSVKDLEEERRLFYVAITRAEKQVTLSYAVNRYKWGNLEMSGPSRFLREIAPRFLHFPQEDDKRSLPSRDRAINPSGGISSSSAYRERVTVDPSKFRRVSSTTAAASGQSGNSNAVFEEGDIVKHDKFGRGTVICIEGVPPNNTATVEFEEVGKKKLLLRFARLDKI